MAGLYCRFRACLKGAEWQRGLKWCLCLAIFGAGLMLAWSGIFDLPGKIWMWWAIDLLLVYAVSGIVMGWVVGKWGGVDAAPA